MGVRAELRRDVGKGAVRGPWIRREQIQRVLGPADPAELIEVVDAKGQTVGWGTWSATSRIAVRLVSRGPSPPAPDWLEARVRAAIAQRAAWGLSAQTDGLREVNAEGDGLGGLVIDRAGQVRIVQVTTAAMAARVDALVALLGREPLATAVGPAAPPVGIIVLAPARAAAREGFAAGHQLFGRPPADGVLRWRAHGLSWSAPAPPSQKTGAYFDQRDNHARFGALCGRPGLRVLDLCAHVGGFALHAARAQAEVVAVDSSASALEALARNAAENGLSVRGVRADVLAPWTAVEHAELAGPWDRVVFDPPKLAPDPRARPRALAALRATLAAIVTRCGPSAVLVHCSCSHAVTSADLDAALADAAASHGQRWQRIERWGPGIDHPVALDHPEGDYLRIGVYQRLA